MRDWLPITRWLPDYQKSWLRADLVSGANVWAVLIPTALAYSSLVGVKPVVGLYCVPLVLLAYAVFGSSKLLVVGPDASVAVLAGATIAAVSIGDDSLQLAVSLALIVGLLYVFFAVLHLGWISDLIPDPVLKGVIEGIVWVTILKQIVHLLGIEIGGETKRFLPKLFEIIETIPETHIQTAALGLACLVGLVILHRFLPRLPGAMIMLAISIIVVHLLGLHHTGVDVLGPTSTDGGSLGLSGFPGPERLAALLPGALSIVVIGFTLSIAAAKRAAEKTGESIDPNQELMAVGAANLSAGISGGYAVAGTLSKTAVAIESGGKTQVSNLFTAVIGVLTILILVPLLSPLADAALAALVIFVMAEISDLPYFARLWRVRRWEWMIGVLAFAGVLAYGPIAGVMVGAFLALVLVADHISRPPTAIIARAADGSFVHTTQENAAEIPGLMIWRQYSPLVFLNARRLSGEVASHVAERENIKVVVLDASATSGVDSTGTTAFITLRDNLARDGIELWVANAREASWTRIVASLSLTDTAAPERFMSLPEAVDRFEQKYGAMSAGSD